MSASRRRLQPSAVRKRRTFRSAKLGCRGSPRSTQQARRLRETAVGRPLTCAPKAARTRPASGRGRRGGGARAIRHRERTRGPLRTPRATLAMSFCLLQLQAGLAALQASVSSAGGSFLNTVLNDSRTFDWTTGSDCTPTQAGVSLPISAFIIAMASAAP
jgi:hypothetical protein